MSIINPMTGRAVKIGSTTHKKLIRQQVLTYSDALSEDEKVLYEFTHSELMQPNYVQAKKKELDKLLPRSQQAVLGRGRYKSCLVVRDRQLGKEDYQAIHREVSRMRDVEEDDEDSEDEPVLRQVQTQMEKKEKQKQANMPKTKSFRIKEERKQKDETIWKPPVDSETEEVDDDDIEEDDEEEY
jgi:hypothetical protein